MFFPAPSPRKILQIIPRLGMGGVEQGTLDITRALIDQGFQAFIISQEGEKISQAESFGATVFRLPVASKNPFIMAQNAYKIKNLCDHYGIHLIHGRSRAPAWSAWHASQLANIPFVTTFHGTYNFTNSLKKYYNSVMVRGQKVIAISNFIKHHIETHYLSWVKPQQITVIHRGIDCNYFDPKKNDPIQMQKLRYEWLLPDDEPVFLMPGRLTAWKGHKYVLSMMPYLEKGILVILGSCQGRIGYLESLRQHAQTLGISHRVRFIESCPTMREAYGLCQGVIHASTDPEAFGRVIAEAQAMGKPIVVSPLGAPQEIIEDQHTGWICDPRNTQQLATLCQNMSQMTSFDFQVRCRSRIQRFFSLEQMTEQTLNLYASLI